MREREPAPPPHDAALAGAQPRLAGAEHDEHDEQEEVFDNIWRGVD